MSTICINQKKTALIKTAEKHTGKSSYFFLRQFHISEVSVALTRETFHFLWDQRERTSFHILKIVQWNKNVTNASMWSHNNLDSSNQSAVVWQWEGGVWHHVTNTTLRRKLGRQSWWHIWEFRLSPHFAVCAMLHLHRENLGLMHTQNYRLLLKNVKKIIYIYLRDYQDLIISCWQCELLISFWRMSARSK